MKTIGLLGGMSWESSAEYYRIMNETVKARLGGLHSAQVLMQSVDFAQYREQMLAGEWDAIGENLSQVAQNLVECGADLIVIGTNTMHMVAPRVAASVGVPLLHIADATAAVLRERGMTRVGLLGTIFTMEKPFYKDRLAEHSIESIIPPRKDRELVDQVIFDELCKGEFRDESRAEYIRIIESLAEQGAEAVILGCTEIGLLVRPNDTSVPLMDTCHIHGEAAVDMALSEK